MVAFVGDAGLEMILGELTTLWDLKLPLVIVVFVDKLLALIELKQRKSGLPNLEWILAQQLSRSGRGFGWKGRWVSSRDELRNALDGVFERETFTLLACRIGEKPYDSRF